MSLFIPEPVPRYQEGLLRYLDTNFERVRQAFANTRRNTVGASTPVSGTTEGDQFWNTTTKSLHVWKGTEWETISGQIPQVLADLRGGQSIASGVDTIVEWAYPTRLNGFGTTLAPVTSFGLPEGWWHVNASVTIGAHGTGARAIYLYKAGTLVRAQVFATVSGTWNWPLNINGLFYVPDGASHTFQVRVHQSSGVSQGMVAAESNFAAVRVSGPGYT